MAERPWMSEEAFEALDVARQERDAARAENTAMRTAIEQAGKKLAWSSATGRQLLVDKVDAARFAAGFLVGELEAALAVLAPWRTPSRPCGG